MHGHNYVIEVGITGEPDSKGWLIDFWDLDRIVKPIFETLDHHCLNDIAGLSNPTAENIARWVYDNIDTALYHTDDGQEGVRVSFIKVFETPDCCAIVTEVNP